MLRCVNLTKTKKNKKKSKDSLFNIAVYPSPYSEWISSISNTYIHTHTHTSEYQRARLNGRLSCMDAGPLQWCSFSAFDPGKEHTVQPSKRGRKRERAQDGVHVNTQRRSVRSHLPFCDRQIVYKWPFGYLHFASLSINTLILSLNRTSFL